MDAGQVIEELSFKVNMALHTLVSDYERGLISRAQARTGVKAIGESVMGLVTQDTFDLIGVIDQQLSDKDTRGAETRVRGIGNGLARSLHFVCGTGQVYAVTGKIQPIYRPDYNDPDAALKGKEIFDRESAKLTEQQSW
jgi:hypothetical protein